MLSDRLAWAQWRLHEGLNYRLRTLAGGRFASRCRPVSTIVLLTENCNARCLHCDIWKNKFKENLTLEDWKTVFTDLRKWLGPVHVCISGGEALMKPFAVDLVRHASGLGLFLEILTHGYWEDQGKIQRLALANPWKITISMDGLGDTHTKVRGQPNFWERTSRSFETFKSMRLQHGLRYTIRLKNVIMSHNLADTVKLAEFAQQDGVEVFFQPIEQNYNTPDDTEWWLHSDNWPAETLFYFLALLNAWVPREWRLKQATSPPSLLLVLAAAALCAISIFFIAPDRLWTQTVGRPQRSPV